MNSTFRITLLALSAVLSAAAPASVNADENYPRLDGPKALAISASDPDIVGIAHAQPNNTVAATLALRECESARPAGAASCEIRRINDEAVTSGAEILARIPRSPHPLYLWRYQGPRATVYLAGSIHLLKPSLYPLPNAYQQAFDQSDHLVLEVNTRAYAAADIQRKTLQMAMLRPSETLATILPAPLYERTRTALARYGLDNNTIDRAKPSLLMNQLVVARLLTLGYLPEFGVEQHFMTQLGGREILELESLDSQFQLLFNQPMPVQIQLLADTLDQEMNIEPILTGLIVAWLSGDDAALEELFQAQAGESELAREFNEALLDRRNVDMARGVRRIIETGKGVYFVLVGAAHYLGDQGIPALLARQNIHGRRITSDTPLSIIQSD
jgi:uncharacterized protein YbaP (TraB family)